MKESRINLSNSLLVLYVLAPVIIYGIPFLFVSFGSINVNVHFYATLPVNPFASLTLLCIHTIVGGIIYLLFRNRAEVRRKKSNFVVFVGLIFAIISMLDFNGYLNLLTFILFVVILSNYRCSIYLIPLVLLIGSLDLFLNDSRNFFIWIAIFLFLAFGDGSVRYLLTIMIVGLVSMVFILQPLKYNLSPLSAFQGISLSHEQVWKHLAPIYVTAFASVEHSADQSVHFSEMIPGIRSFTNEISIVDKLSKEYLPPAIYNDGTRLGSNSGLLFSSSAILPFFLSLLILSASAYLAKLSVFVRNTMVCYLVIYGPYFIRRGFYSYIYDFFFIIIMAMMVLFIIQNLRFLFSQKDPQIMDDLKC